jgi:hypothetical protein
MALSAAINNDVLQSRDGKIAELTQPSPNCESPITRSALSTTYISK